MCKLFSSFSGLLRSPGSESRSCIQPLSSELRQINDLEARGCATSLTLHVEGSGEQKWL